MLDPYPRIILIPGLGMITTGKDLKGAGVAGGLYHRAIVDIANAEALDRYTSMTDPEAFSIEYWPLELLKLTLAPPEAEFSRRVALVTGGCQRHWQSHRRATRRGGRTRGNSRR